MFDSSLFRFISLITGMAVVGLIWYFIDLSRLKKKGIEKAEAVLRAKKQAKKIALIAAFLNMVSMVSIAGLFM